MHPHKQAFIQICHEGHSIALEVERIFEIKKKKINNVLGFLENLSELRCPMGHS